MFASIIRFVVLLVLLSVTTAPRLAAQSIDRVKSDIYAALSTPLPITIVGPLLTRDVEVSEDGEGFRAVMKDTVLMGLFPFGDISFHLEAVDDTHYKVSDLTLPRDLDFPGMGRIKHSAMRMEGLWSTADRSYSSLSWSIDGLDLRGPEGMPGFVTIGQLALDVLKEPDERDTESRFEITARDVAMKNLGPQDVTLGVVRARLAANGEEPVDLYSTIRELAMTGSAPDAGARLAALGRTLLGNRYDTVTLDLAAQDFDMKNRARPEQSYMRAGALALRVGLSDVLPRTWGGTEIKLSMTDVDQSDSREAAVKVGEAVFRLTGETLPVADMLTTYRLLENPPRGQATPVSMILDGIVNFGKLEFESGGKSVLVGIYDRRRKDESWVYEKSFDTGYDFWAVKLGVEGLDRNAGTLSLASALRGGEFIPAAGFPMEALPHLRAWFPTTLELQTQVGDLNEGFLKQLFEGVEIQDLREPVEIVMPLMLYVAATVFDVQSGENQYETSLFRLEQSGNYKLYPTEVLGLAPYAGAASLRITGLSKLMGYLDETQAALRPGSDDAQAMGALKSGLVVLRNIAVQGEGGALEWVIDRPDVERNVFELNGIEMRYPDILSMMPSLMFGTMFRRF
ncbi:hypothetical protein [Rhodalgimonas zhirmunskyi]|uniref:Uncharacterized protein n=1 Tax=Rhodalgimonas zhirmunskyi TaxID=2964767 RepID=A0AAJ1UGG4_9RHOB|nr:hypothetical protein [Rhodoalgimonas zhirmunskyi]MDQ2095651.1 hypothetical protein [Rhodoalgimonas zhirmunskyi]